MVLLFMQLFALISLYGLTRATDEMKLNSLNWQRMQSLLLAKLLLQKLEQEMTEYTPACFVPILPTFELAKKPISWWQIHACSGNFAGNQYYYVFESLGKDACSAVAKGNNQAVAVNYYRLSLFLWSPQERAIKIRLQSTLARESAEPPSCVDHLHLVKPGRQMWREL